jgi:hypothetical protein
MWSTQTVVILIVVAAWIGFFLGFLLCSMIATGADRRSDCKSNGRVVGFGGQPLICKNYKGV